MRNGRLTQQRGFSGPIRWIAGLFCLLTFAYGASSTATVEFPDPRDDRTGALYTALAVQLATAAEHATATRELLGSNSASEAEGDWEEEPVASLPLRLSRLPSEHLALRRVGDRRPFHRASASVDPRAPRAPPHA